MTGAPITRVRRTFTKISSIEKAVDAEGESAHPATDETLRKVNPKIYRFKATQNLADDAMNVTTEIPTCVRWKLANIYFHSNIDISETLTLKFDSKDGASYDTVLKTISLDTESDYVWTRGDEEFYGEDGDQLNFQCTNSGGSGIVYLTMIILYYELP